ncbi:MAG: hypothetical protein QXX12_00340 [Nanopusillaceae archaeon]
MLCLEVREVGGRRTVEECYEQGDDVVASVYVSVSDMSLSSVARELAEILERAEFARGSAVDSDEVHAALSPFFPVEQTGRIVRGHVRSGECVYYVSVFLKVDDETGEHHENLVHVDVERIGGAALLTSVKAGFRDAGAVVSLIAELMSFACRRTGCSDF